jgi:hypothetical protein
MRLGSRAHIRKPSPHAINLVATVCLFYPLARLHALDLLSAAIRHRHGSFAAVGWRRKAISAAPLAVSTPKDIHLYLLLRLQLESFGKMHASPSDCSPEWWNRRAPWPGLARTFLLQLGSVHVLGPFMATCRLSRLEELVLDASD